MSISRRCVACGSTGVEKIVRAVRVFVCPTCDRAKCGSCGRAGLPQTAVRCPDCGAKVRALK